MIDKKEHHLFDIDRPRKYQYVMFDVMGVTAGKIILVIKVPDDYELEIGRVGCEITVPDATVGRKHATLKYDLKIGELLLKDCESSYRSQILIQRPIRLHLGKPIMLLNGQSLMKVELKKDKKWTVKNLLCSCFMSSHE